MRVISSELNDTLRVFEIIKVLNVDYIESLILQYDTHIQSCTCIFTFQNKKKALSVAKDIFTCCGLTNRVASHAFHYN